MSLKAFQKFQKWTNEVLYGILSSCKPSDLSQEAPKTEHLEKELHKGRYRSRYLNFDKILNVILCRNSKSKTRLSAYSMVCEHCNPKGIYQLLQPCGQNACKPHGIPYFIALRVASVRK